MQSTTPTRTVLCFYHDDPDGWCSGAIVKRTYPEATCIPMNYGKPFPWDTIPKDTANTLVIMVDFSLQPFTDMIKLRDLLPVKQFVWIDHHKTAIDDSENVRESFCGCREVGKAGCELTWEFFQCFKPMPDPVKWIGRYDVWDHENCHQAMPFQYGLKTNSEARYPDTQFWADLLTDQNFQEDILCNGYLIEKYVQQTNVMICDRSAFETKLGGLPAIAVNSPYCNSMVFDSVWSPAEHKLMISYYRTPHHWTVSLYSTHNDINCGSIAKKFGGGGHKGAAGFQCQQLPFPFPQIEPEIIILTHEDFKERKGLREYSINDINTLSLEAIAAADQIIVTDQMLTVYLKDRTGEYSPGRLYSHEALKEETVTSAQP